ncbi:hypothetical protein E2C01_098804 [Portunus trituberculatus]|uniref:Uncharacterized protein n=1 Tax=Portunus trituberculatus TaxID=210409 RepID=A0A5B7KDS9_PORTR|nr:hypothetical protein [Portunus trituberculatus]
MQENVILMTVAAQVTNGGGGEGTPRSLCVQPRVWTFRLSGIFSSIKLNFCIRVLKSSSI